MCRADDSSSSGSLLTIILCTVAVTPINPVTGEDLRAVSELHWRLVKQSVDNLGTKIVDLYNVSGDTPAMIDLIDEVVTIIRRKGVSRNKRVQEIGHLMLKRAPRG
jgi:hypothetical protein